VAFARGAYTAGSTAGRRLLAHELTHVGQQAASRSTSQQVQRVPARRAATPDPICVSYDEAVRAHEITQRIAALKVKPDVEERLLLVQALKWVRRCGTADVQRGTAARLRTELGGAEGAAVWRESGTPLGGHRAAYPGYYAGARRRLRALGIRETEPYAAFGYEPGSSDEATFAPAAESAAMAEAATVTATDLLYFYGHQYAQYDNPGVFANFAQTRFIDLRALAGKGDFSRVKLVVSTSCATCCTEAIEVFSALFPRAVILGYRKSAPLDGESVRNSFDAGISALKRPLLLDQPIDVAAVIGVWKSVVRRAHPNEDQRLPGYYQNGVVHYLERGRWKSMPATDPANTCKKKGSTLVEAGG